MHERMVLLSAADEDRLTRLARGYRDMLDGDAPRLADIAFTSQVGRVPLGHRLAVLSPDTGGLRAALDDVVAGRRNPAVRRSVVHAAPAPGTPAPPVADADAALAAWLAGHDVDWRVLWTTPGRRVSLPSYPFEEEAAVEETAVAPGATVDYLCAMFAEVAGLDVSEVRPDTPLEELGLSSFLIGRLNARLEQDRGERSRTLFFEHPTLAAVAAALGAQTPSGTGDIAVPPAPEGPEPMAVIGLSGRFPGADSVEEFWRLLSRGGCAVGPVPADRTRPGWPDSLMHGGYLSQVDRFDPLLFGITPREAERMDPQERLCLETVWEALDDAGYPRERLRAAHRSRVGVYVGSMYNEYPYFGVEQSLAGPPVDSGSVVAGIANRVSFAFDLHGPSMTVDTMCSASLVALHLATRALRAGECEVAVVAATNLSLHANKFRQIDRLGGAASDNLCRSFGRGGDGMVPGEAVAALLVKPLSAARRDGDRVHAVISGSAVVNAGRTNGWIVPSPAAQAEVVRLALADARVEPEHIGYLEAHGAGTALGDPIEADGLHRVFHGTRGTGSLPIGSVKSNIGHTEAAAGLAGLVKVILQMRHRTLVPSLHAEELNPDIDWAGSPLRVQRDSRPWTADGGAPLRAGVSSFGAGGTLAHVIVEEAPPELAPDAVRPPAPARPTLIMLSGYDAERLTAVIRRLYEHLRAEPGTDLADLAFTLAEGRHHLRERAAVVVSGIAELTDRLRRHLDGDPEALLRGRARAGARASGGVSPDGVTEPAGGIRPAGGARPDEPGAWGDPHEPARAWVAGGDVRMPATGGGRPPRVLSLPGYPFARVRCWIAENAPAVPAVAPPSGAGLPLYRRTWQPDGPIGEPAAVAGSVLCVYAPGSRALAGALVRVLGRDRVQLLCEGGDGPVRGYVAGSSGTALADEVLAAREDLAAVIDVADLDRPGGDPGPWQVRLALLQRLAAAGPARRVAGRPALHVLHAAGESGDAPLAAFVRFLGAESSHLTGVSVRLAGTGDAVSRDVVAVRPADAVVRDVPAVRPADAVVRNVPDARPADAVVRDLLAALPGDGYGETLHRDGVRHRPVLTPVDWPETAAPRLDTYGVYLLTGGTRGIGARVARHLVARGARHLALLGARSLPPAQRWDDPDLDQAARQAVDAVRALEAAGARVHVYHGSLVDRAELHDFLHRVRQESGPVRGAVHCAAVTPPVGPFAGRDPADIHRVLEPKADAFRVLYDLCLPDRPDFLVGFSSLAAVVPPVAAGVLDYAAANAMVDAAAARFAADTAWVSSIAWPMWRGSGGVNPGAAFGLDAVDDDEGLRALDRVIAAGAGGPVVALRPLTPGDPSELLRLATPATATPKPPTQAPAAQMPAAQVPAAHVPAAPALAAPTPGAPTPGVAPAGPATEAGAVPEWLLAIFARVSGIPAADLAPDVEFAEIGVESVMLGELLEEIEGHAGMPLDPTLLLEFSTLATLAAKLNEILPTASPATAAVVTSPATAAVVTGHRPGPESRESAGAVPPESEVDPRAIAVIGMACRLPGADDVTTYWRNLRDGHQAVTEAPASRWDVDRFYRPIAGSGWTTGKWGGFVSGIEDFDAVHFGLTDDQARYLDPTIRLFLETTADCLRDAGLEGPELAGRDVGVFAGARSSGYAARGPVSAEVPESDPNFVASHVGQHFDLRGPHLVVDTACSSSLVAVHLACQSLRSGESEMAIAGGSSVLLDEGPYLEFSAAGALSPSGRCAAFDKRADGFVPGEGSVALLLKPLAAALRDGDPVHAVIEGSAVTNDGRTMGLTTPNPAAQAAAISRALRDAGREPAEVGMIEAHGTGTAIGDPLEFRALCTVFDRDPTIPSGQIRIGSVKSNVGHLLHAAGAAGLLKALLAVKHGSVPATLHCDEPNPRLKWDGSPFTPATETQPWPSSGQRVAGVSSFGFGGTNAHVVVAEVPSAVRAAARQPRQSRPPIDFERRRLWLARPGRPAPDGTAPASLRLTFR
ncbi:SDR family NAD(P)-dependent oxidoreductase [Actinoplanes missouriensis]|uniref:SDR family NAD(P)-dependent oxidoreductase n=1 Tax=Actinoplanes missouriensis TaxID=1866 RepID=UPI0033F2DCA2